MILSLLCLNALYSKLYLTRKCHLGVDIVALSRLALYSELFAVLYGICSAVSNFALCGLVSGYNPNNTYGPIRLSRVKTTSFVSLLVTY